MGNTLFDPVHRERVFPNVDRQIIHNFHLIEESQAIRPRKYLYFSFVKTILT